MVMRLSDSSSERKHLWQGMASRLGRLTSRCAAAHWICSLVPLLLVLLAAGPTVALGAEDFLAVPAAASGGAAVAPAGSAPAPSPFGGSFVMMFVLMFVIFYFLVIRPQSVKDRQQAQLLAALKKGDEVVTSSGMVGRVWAIEDAFISVEVASNTRIRFEKNHIVRKLE